MTEDEAVFHQKLYRVVEMSNGMYRVQNRDALHFNFKNNDPWSFVDGKMSYTTLSEAEDVAKQLKKRNEEKIKSKIVRKAYDPV